MRGWLAASRKPITRGVMTTIRRPRLRRGSSWRSECPCRGALRCSGPAHITRKVETSDFRLLFELADEPVLLLCRGRCNQVLALRGARPLVDVDANRLVGACGDVAHVERPAGDGQFVVGARFDRLRPGRAPITITPSRLFTISRPVSCQSCRCSFRGRRSTRPPSEMALRNSRAA